MICTKLDKDIRNKLENYYMSNAQNILLKLKKKVSVYSKIFFIITHKFFISISSLLFLIYFFKGGYSLYLSLYFWSMTMMIYSIIYNHIYKSGPQKKHNFFYNRIISSSNVDFEFFNEIKNILNKQEMLYLMESTGIKKLKYEDIYLNPVSIHNLRIEVKNTLKKEKTIQKKVIEKEKLPPFDLFLKKWILERRNKRKEKVLNKKSNFIKNLYEE